MPGIDGIGDRIARIFTAALHVDVPSADTDLFETGVLDSLAFVELLLQLEREFGVTVAAEDLEAENFRSLDRIREFVESQAVLSAESRVVPLIRRR